MLGDIIDYDELLTGERMEAMYTTVETNLQQGIEVVLAIALLVMGVAGYKPLGGCSCGCGVNCPHQGIDYARFVCDGFVGYACDDSITSDTRSDNPLLFHPEPDRLPCAWQELPVRVVTTIFFFGLPGVCGLLCIYPARRAIIDNEQLKEILAGIEELKANPSATVVDPIFGGSVVRPTNTADNLMRDAFTHFEWKSIARFVGDAEQRRGLQLMGYLGGRLAFYVALLIGLIVANPITAANDAGVGQVIRRPLESLMQVTFIFVAVLVVALPLDSLRFDGTRREAKARVRDLDDGIPIDSRSGGRGPARR